jgi:hypothetical protein
MLKVAVAVRVREPLVPVIATAKDPAVLLMQESVALPDPLMLFGLIDPHVRPEGITSLRVTVPLKPFCDVTVIVELTDWPTVIPLIEVAERVKSGPVTPMISALRPVAAASFDAIVVRPQLSSTILRVEK